MRLGLILEGGGVKGAYQAGAMSVLDELGVTFDGLAGTSIGAINSAYYIQGGLSLMREVWGNMGLTSIMKIDESVVEHFKNRDLDIDTLLTLGRNIFPISDFLQQSFDMTQNFFKSKVNEDDLRNSGKDLGLVTYNITKRKAVEALMDEIEYGKLLDFLVASATYPVFAPKVIDGEKYTDGGVINNIPINILARRGYKNMLVIRTHPDVKLPKYVTLTDDLNVFFIRPAEELGRAMTFTSARAHELFQLGEDECRRALQNGLDEFLAEIE